MKVPNEKVGVFHVLTEVFSTINAFFFKIGFNPFGLPSMIRT